MLRHSTSLFVSVMMHAALIAGALLVYRMYQSSQSTPEESRVCLCLAQIVKAVPPAVPVVKAPPPETPRQMHPVPPPIPPRAKPSTPIVKREMRKQESVVSKVVKKQVETPRTIQEEPVKHKELKAQTLPEVLEHEVPMVPQSTPNPGDAGMSKHVKPMIKSTQERYLDEHLQVISQLLRRYLYYPKRARKRHIEGTVVLVFELLKNGDIGTIHIKKSSSRAILDRAATKTILKLSGKVPKPPKMISIEIPIQFRLRS